MPKSNKAAVIHQTISAPRERVYQAWTSPDEARAWGAPDELRVAAFDADFRIGGRYRLAMAAPDGTRHVAVGEYRAIIPPTHLEYTWSWEDDPDVKDSIVTIDFIPHGAATEVVLRHAGLPSDDSVESHTEGWRSSIEKLARYVEHVTTGVTEPPSRSARSRA